MSLLVTNLHQKLLLNAPDSESYEIRQLEDRLRHIKVFLEGRGCGSSNPDKWIANIKRVVFDIEDLIELYHLRKEQLRKLSVFAFAVKIPSRIPFIGILNRQDSKSSNILNYINSLDNVIEDQKRTTAAAAAASYHIPVRECAPCGQEKFMVGLEEDTATLISELIGDETLTNLRSVSIVGMGGIGKTSLAGKVYTDPIIAGIFTCFLWISVTQHFNYQELLVSILIQGTQTSSLLGDLQVPQLEAMVHEFLDDKRYLAVLDDVWTQEAWDSIKHVFNDTNMGSRLIVTTRNHELQTSTPGIRHLMKALDEQESRNLFCQKASIEAHSTEFESIQVELLKVCDGLPLAIIVVARELYKERRKEKWDAVYQQLSTLQGPLVQDITNVLALSCDNLPLDLRSCFLRIGFFPKTVEISSEELIYLWEAEGLLASSNQDERETQSIGNEYLITFINKSLLQAADVGSDGSIKSCKIHPLMQVLAASKAQEEIYFQTDASSEIRHGTIFASTTSLTHFSNAPHLRSLLSFKPGGDISSKVLKSICRHSPLLKVLDLKGMNVRKLPFAVGINLWNLRYLNLRKTGINYLPHSVGYLVRLLILDVRENSGLKRINVVKNLKNLRILLLDDSLEPFKLGKLTQLRTLGWVRPEHLRRNDIAKNNGNLEVLKVIIHDSSKFEEFVKALFNLVHLSNLPSSSPSSSVTGFCNMKKLKRLLLKVRMSEPERPSNTARGFYLLPEELATLPDFSISTLCNKSIEESGLLADSGHGFHPHIYIEYL